MAYDFNQVFSETYTPSGSGSVTVVRSNLRILDGLFGPTFSTGHGPVRLFATVKGGFVNFRFDPRPATFATFSSSVTDLRAGDVDGVLYPGGGVEGFIGPVGLRLEAGDEIYFNGGAHNNLRITFGPSIRHKGGIRLGYSVRRPAIREVIAGWSTAARPLRCLIGGGAALRPLHQRASAFRAPAIL